MPCLREITVPEHTPAASAKLRQAATSSDGALWPAGYFDGLTAEQWESLSAAEHREAAPLLVVPSDRIRDQWIAEAAERRRQADIKEADRVARERKAAGLESIEEEKRRIAAAADPAATAAADRLLAAAKALPERPNPWIHPDRKPLQGKSTGRCENMAGILLKSGGGRFVGWAKKCGYRTCKGCHHAVAEEKLSDLDEVFDVVGVTASQTLYTATIPESDLRKTCDRIKAHGFSGRHVPRLDVATGELGRVVITDDPAEGAPVTADEARNILDSAQRALVECDVGKRQVRFFGYWEKVHQEANKRRKAAAEAEKASAAADADRLEFAGFYASQKHFAEACERLKLPIEATATEHSTTIETTVPIWVRDDFLTLIVFVSVDELAAIAETKACHRFEDQTKAIAAARAAENYQRRQASAAQAQAAARQAHQITAQRIPPPDLFSELIAA